jgi:hypothetical protein
MFCSLESKIAVIPRVRHHQQNPLYCHMLFVCPKSKKPEAVKLTHSLGTCLPETCRSRGTPPHSCLLSEPRGLGKLSQYAPLTGVHTRESDRWAPLVLSAHPCAPWTRQQGPLPAGGHSPPPKPPEPTYLHANQRKWQQALTQPLTPL